MTETSFVPLNWQELTLRLSIAFIVGATIGLEREIKSKPAGLRTNILVCFSSALIVIVPIQIGAAQQNLDVLGRVISGVITGVSFIGGGTILRDPDRVKGLTSAAAIWVTAVLGITIGCGLLWLGIIGATVTWVVLRLFAIWEKKL
ncbi:MgtC/SapB family protein [Myxosarcina sp. GI1]|uniref:MgtC/SapB family protein n=1 Tax=Myxosarcina sp. GI1 TaxID=1541065 RepID=UPI00055E6DC3|nr:MgtC/SapB family protein [Myxosarcina sp. GI1]